MAETQKERLEALEEMLDQRAKNAIEINYGYVVEIGYHTFKFPNAFVASRFMSEAVRGTLRNGDYRVSSMGYIDNICMKPIMDPEDEDEDKDDKED